MSREYAMSVDYVALLKGLMSEMELHIMRNRLLRGRDNKAARGEMFHSVPMGYVILPTGEVAFDPDQQAREVMQLFFDKFKELGTIYGVFHWLLQHDIKMPIRPRSGAKKGQLTWRRPSIPSLAQVLRHPIYAGAYAYGRRPLDPKGENDRCRPWVPMERFRASGPSTVTFGACCGCGGRGGSMEADDINDFNIDWLHCNFPNALCDDVFLEALNLHTYRLWLLAQWAERRKRLEALLSPRGFEMN